MRRNTRRSYAHFGTHKACLCGAVIEGRGRLCNKCRRRRRWLHRMNGKRRDLSREINRANIYFREAVNAS